MTLKEETLKDFRLRFPRLQAVYPDKNGDCDYESCEDEVEAFISETLDRYAFSVVRETVPDEKGHPVYGPDMEEIGFNSCRSETLTKAKELTNQ